jgi:hypothetical protein
VCDGKKRIFTFVIGGWSPSLVLEEEKVETDCLVEEEEELCCMDTLLLLVPTSPSDQHTIVMSWSDSMPQNKVPEEEIKRLRRL